MIEFDKLQFAKNVSCLLKDKGIKIGDYEKSVGVSAGYLSRVSKDDAIKPNIDFIVRTANLLDVSIDTLLEADLSDLSSTELLFLSFLHKLQSDTIGEQLEWKRESADVLNSIETYGGGGSRHPLFYGFQTGTTEDPLYPEPVFTGLASFSSNALGLNTVIDDDCFFTEMNHSVTIYVMHFRGSDASIESSSLIEIWFVKDDGERSFAGGTGNFTNISSSFFELYKSIKGYLSRPHLTNTARDIIDSYLNPAKVSMPQVQISRSSNTQTVPKAYKPSEGTTTKTRIPVRVVSKKNHVQRIMDDFKDDDEPF